MLWDCDAELSAFSTTACSRRPRSPWRTLLPSGVDGSGITLRRSAAAITFWLAVLKTGGVVTPFVLDDAAVDVPSAAPSLTPVPVAGWVLDQGLAELAEAYALFLEPGLQLVELLEVRVLSSYGG